MKKLLIILMIILAPQISYAGWFDDIGDFFGDLGDAIGDIDSVGDVFELAGDLIEFAVVNTVGVVEDIVEGVVGVGEEIFDVVGDAGAVVLGAVGLSQIAPSATEVLEGLGVANAGAILGSAEGLVPGFATPFGGRILFYFPCTCSATELIIVAKSQSIGPTEIIVPIALTVQWPGFSTIYEYWNYRTPGNAILGTYSLGPQCIMAAGPFCVPIPTHGAIDSFPGAGTSALPAL